MSSSPHDDLIARRRSRAERHQRQRSAAQPLPAAPETPTLEDGIELLQSGDIVRCEEIPWSSNYTFVVTLHGHGDLTGLGVYKPRKGEQPLHDFPSGTLYKRERAAYLTSRALGWTFIPPTVIRDGPFGIGSVQRFIEPAADTIDFDGLRRTHRAPLARIACYDLVANNADRKAGHVLKDEEDGLWGIDHGLTFNIAPKLRTVLWDFRGEPIAEPLLDDLRRFRADRQRSQWLGDLLSELISPREYAAFVDRVDQLIEAGTYPDLDPYRNVPWPLY